MHDNIFTRQSVITVYLQVADKVFARDYKEQVNY